jgi:hypothetical protein
MNLMKFLRLDLLKSRNQAQVTKKKFDLNKDIYIFLDFERFRGEI